MEYVISGGVFLTTSPSLCLHIHSSSWESGRGVMLSGVRERADGLGVWTGLVSGVADAIGMCCGSLFPLSQLMVILDLGSLDHVVFSNTCLMFKTSSLETRLDHFYARRQRRMSALSWDLPRFHDRFTIQINISGPTVVYCCVGDCHWQSHHCIVFTR